jgi:rod shape-determining protein MreC
LDYRDTTKYSLLPAKVISKLVSGTKGNMIINRGLSDSINIGMPVINEKGLVGLIVNSSENFSQVRPVNNSNLKITGKIQRINADGIISWDGRKLVMKNLPSTVDVRIGDRIVTSDFSTILPPAIPVGIATDVTTIYSATLINVTIEPFADLHSVNDVFVLKMVLSKQIENFELNLYN